MQRQRARKSDSQFAFPNAPECIEPSILREASEWQGLDEYDILVKLEERTGLEAEIAKVPLGADMWGFTYTSREMNRCRIHINRTLPRFWQEFALFHEIHHLL
ncbi:MAG: ImmA/IrrE family metallo-endopeptidase, partial [Pyramidobacter sp.]|nr:ImmA/IrrE family metallo-endopeptidase [Pyramidobacter sp.]